ncbi:MAG: glucose-6-phosphate isomerase [Micropepsaceae bacterium]
MNQYNHDISTALAQPDLSAAFARRKPEADQALKFWSTTKDRNFLAFRRSLEREDDLDPAATIVRHISRDASDVVILGIGGSSLGAQAIAQLKFWGTPAYRAATGSPRLHIIDNLDGATFARFLNTVDLKTTRFHVVSKSGSTAEPLLQLLAVIAAIESAGGGKYLKHHFSGEAEAGKNALRSILTGIGSPMLEHDPDLGGRYTAFSTVGLVPAMLAGVDAAAFRAAGRKALDAGMQGHSKAVAGAALSVAARDIGLSQQVMWCYSDRLERLAKWWRQLWAESLGKQGHGTTPVDALGPVDQHSQLQLYLDGPRDKLFTLIEAPAPSEAKASLEWATRYKLDLYAGRDLSLVASAQARATAETLGKSARPVRRITLQHPLDESGLANLLVHFILETLIAARLWNVDPFGQPAVEEGKILTRQYLENGS